MIGRFSSGLGECGQPLTLSWEEDARIHRLARSEQAIFDFDRSFPEPRRYVLFFFSLEHFKICLCRPT